MFLVTQTGPNGVYASSYRSFTTLENARNYVTRCPYPGEMRIYQVFPDKEPLLIKREKK